MNTAQSIQRRQLVIDPKFQYGLILRLSLLVTVVLTASLTLLALLFSRFANVALPVSPDSGGVVSFEATQVIRLPEVIWLVLAVILLSVITASIVVYFFGVFFSHRMAGPAYRLRSCIAEMADGELNRKVSLRQKDYFQLLATDINCLRQQWHDSVKELKTIHQELYEVADDKQKELLDRLQGKLSDLLKTISE